jgi:hypothetical protein
MKPAQPFGLRRTSTGLSEAHKQLIRLLAERAVEQFLRETDEAEQKEA